MSRCERGATTVEWVLVLLGVAALVGVANVALPSGMGAMFRAVVCPLIEDCRSPAASAESVEPWSDPDPIRRTTWGDYIALGDSYSSGEGNGDFGAGGSRESCHASTHAYSQVLRTRLPFAGSIRLGACTGAVVGDLATQTDLVDPGASLVTLTIGGNDLDWAGILRTCALAHATFKSCARTEDASVNERVTGLRPRLVAAYRAIRERAPHARVVVIGYPRLFPMKPAADFRAYGVTITDRPTQTWINAKADEINSMIASAASEAGVEYVDAGNAFDGHELTTDDPWLFGISAAFHWPPVATSSIHPTATGQARLEEVLERYLRER